MGEHSGHRPRTDAEPHTRQAKTRVPGLTRLAKPISGRLLYAMSEQAYNILIVSDGYENSPAGACDADVFCLPRATGRVPIIAFIMPSFALQGLLGGTCSTESMRPTQLPAIPLADSVGFVCVWILQARIVSCENSVDQSRHQCQIVRAGWRARDGKTRRRP